MSLIHVVAYDAKGITAEQPASDEAEATRLAADWLTTGVLAEVLGGSQTCNRCGECCRRGPRCTMFRPLLGLPADFAGQCELLREDCDGSTTCRAIEQLAAKSPPVLQYWGVTGGCNFPHLRRELLQIGVAQ